jgi:hypothetical protein
MNFKGRGEERGAITLLKRDALIGGFILHLLKL